MQKFLTSAQMRTAEGYTINALGVPVAELMERAGNAIAKHVLKAAAGGKKVNVVCGGGNNGGDGYVCARILAERGVRVSVFDAAADSRSPECTEAKRKYVGLYAESIGGDVIVDCILGTGCNRPVEGKLAEAIKVINKSGAYVISADIPSGICSDNGLALGEAVKADLTVALGEYKLGHVLGDGPDYCGAMVKDDIGINVEGDVARAFDDDDVAAFFPARRRNSHKGTYGSACICAGSTKYPGAAALCLMGALRSGCGYVNLATVPEVRSALFPVFPQAIYLSSPDVSADAIAIGPGCGDSTQTFSSLRNVLRNHSCKLIIDADAINALSKNISIIGEAGCAVLLTPHVAEFSRLTGISVRDILADPVGKARSFAAEYGVTVALKGAATVITDGKRVTLNLRGNTALARGGSGDILTGLLCGAAARGLNLYDAAVSSCYVLGAAAELASAEATEYCATAEDIVGNIPQAVKIITRL